MPPPGWDNRPSQVSSLQMPVLNYRPHEDGKLSDLWQKKGHTNLRISAELGIKPGILRLGGGGGDGDEGRNVNNSTNPAEVMYSLRIIFPSRNIKCILRESRYSNRY